VTKRYYELDATRRTTRDARETRAATREPREREVERLLGALLQVRDQIRAVFRLLQTGEDHLRARNVLLRVQQVVVQGVLAPGDALVLVRRAVRETLRGAGDAAEQAAEVRTLSSDRACVAASVDRRDSRAPRVVVVPRDASARRIERVVARRLAAPLARSPRRRRLVRTCLCPPPFSATWHCAHFVLKIFAPVLVDRARRRVVSRRSVARDRVDNVTHPSCARSRLPRARASSSRAPRVAARSTHPSRRSRPALR